MLTLFIVCLLPHCTHKVQPLSTAFMQPRKPYYAQKVEAWLKSHPPQVVTYYQIGYLLSLAHL